jgi:hypothetical protein
MVLHKVILQGMIISHQVFSEEEHERGFDLAYFLPLATVAATLEEF